MTAQRFDHTQLMHGLDYSGEECAGWLAQRKWDGHFAGWDGERLFSKDGHTIPAPDFFLAGLPDFPLCCELVAGKEGANQTTSLVRTKNNPREWELAKLYVFDAPEFNGAQHLAWNVEDRLSEAGTRWVQTTRYAEICRVTRILNRTHLLGLLAVLLHNRGEGLMIQPPDHPYTAGRTRGLLKVKRQSLHILNSVLSRKPKP